jgi:hypothetical protein
LLSVGVPSGREREREGDRKREKEKERKRIKSIGISVRKVLHVYLSISLNPPPFGATQRHKMKSHSLNAFWWLKKQDSLSLTSEERQNECLQSSRRYSGDNNRRTTTTAVKMAVRDIYFKLSTSLFLLFSLQKHIVIDF